MHFLKKEENCFCFSKRDLNRQYVNDIILLHEMYLLQRKVIVISGNANLDTHIVLKQLELPIFLIFCEICTRSKLCATPVGKGPRKRESEQW